MLSATLWVDPNVAPSGNIFTKIAEAVAAAHSGDTIKVVAGTYAESVDVTKSLSIIGGQVRVSNEPVGASVVTSIPPASGIGFSLDANGVTIKNFEIAQDHIGIMTAANFSGLSILNNNFQGDAIGIDFNSSLTNSAKNRISGNQFGVVAGFQSTNDIQTDIATQNLTISHNTFTGNSKQNSISLFGTGQSKNIQIVNNQVGQSSTFTADAGITVGNASNVKVNGNTIVSPSNTGIELNGVTNSVVAGNTLAYLAVGGSPPIGIELDSMCNSNKISDNLVTGFSDGFFMLDNLSQNMIKGNTVTHSQDVGIVLENSDGSGNSISSNTVTSSARFGISVESPSNTISNNTVSDNGDVGIYLDGAGGNNTTGNKVSGNTVNDNATYGIKLDGDNSGKGNGIKLSKNSVSENAFSGVFLNGSSQDMLSNNVINNNKDAGIVTVGSTGDTISNNICNSNASEGIVLESGSDSNTLKGNVAAFNFNGIELDDSGSNTLSGNMVAHSHFNGFYLLDGATANTLSGNVAGGNFDGFSATSGSNMFTKNAANNNFNEGFDIESNGNTLSKNSASGNLAGGFFIEDDDNIVQNNTATGNQESGFAIAYSNAGTMVVGNTASNNGSDGIFVSHSVSCTVSGNTAKNNQRNGIHVDNFSTGNTISGNTASGNGDAFGGFDLIDDWGDTIHNAWSNNKAVTRHPSNLG
jgi:parallel beta-helix repeat protein